MIIRGQVRPTRLFTLPKGLPYTINMVYTIIKCSRVWVGLSPPSNMSALATSGPPKFYVVSYTNKTGDLEAIFEISYFQSTQKPKCLKC